MWIISVTDVYSGIQEWSESIYKTISRFSFNLFPFHFLLLERSIQENDKLDRKKGEWGNHFGGF